MSSQGDVLFRKALKWLPTVLLAALVEAELDDPVVLRSFPRIRGRTSRTHSGAGRWYWCCIIGDTTEPSSAITAMIGAATGGRTVIDATATGAATIGAATMGFGGIGKRARGKRSRGAGKPSAAGAVFSSGVSEARTGKARRLVSVSSGQEGTNRRIASILPFCTTDSTAGGSPMLGDPQVL